MLAPREERRIGQMADGHMLVLLGHAGLFVARSCPPKSNRTPKSEMDIFLPLNSTKSPMTIENTATGI